MMLKNPCKRLALFRYDKEALEKFSKFLCSRIHNSTCFKRENILHHIRFTDKSRLRCINALTELKVNALVLSSFNVVKIALI